jgi:hypothetical protein
LERARRHCSLVEVFCYIYSCAKHGADGRLLLGGEISHVRTAKRVSSIGSAETGEQDEQGCEVHISVD